MDEVPIRGARYEIVIRGELDSRYAHLFEGMQMERADGTTVLTGSVRDRAQLYGHIDRIEELGLELVSVQPTQRDVEPAHEAPA
jgi:hypothetical protein